MNTNFVIAQVLKTPRPIIPPVPKITVSRKFYRLIVTVVYDGLFELNAPVVSLQGTTVTPEELPTDPELEVPAYIL